MVHSIHIGPILSTLVLFSPHWSYLVHSIHFGTIQSTLVLFGPTWSYSILLFLFSYYIHFGPNLSIRSYSVQFGPLKSFSVHIGTLSPIHSTLVLFGPFWSTLFSFDLILFYLVQFIPFVSTSVQSDHFGLF